MELTNGLKTLLITTVEVPLQITQQKKVFGTGEAEIVKLKQKNKEVLILQTQKYTNTYNSEYTNYTTNKTYEGSECPIERIKIDKLTNKEIIVKSEGKRNRFKRYGYRNLRSYLRKRIINKLFI